MKATLLILTMGGLLAAAAGVAVYTWNQMSGVALSTDGVIALVLGVLASLALGIGLMTLVFFSHRRGYDRIDRGPGGRPPKPHARDGADAGTETDADAEPGPDRGGR